MTLRLRLMIVGVLLTGALVAMVANHQRILVTGEEVVLEVVPVDPRSLFRGDYVQLDYAAARLRFAEIEGDNDLRYNETAYVVLRKGEPHWRPGAVYRERPPPGTGGVVIRGRVKSTCAGRRCDRYDVLMDYGIGKYFVPEGEGKAIEKARQRRRVAVVARIGRDGTAAIKGVLIDGKLVYEERLY